MDAGKIKAKLEKEVIEATWKALAPHEERGVLICVARSLFLTDVGTAVAINDTNLVSKWMEEGEIFKPSPEQKELWSQAPLKLFSMIIVQPFVLVQEMTEEEEKMLLAEKAEHKLDV